MYTASNMGPIQLAALTYLLCAVISLGVAGIIAIIFSYIKMQQRKATVKAAAVTDQPQ